MERSENFGFYLPSSDIDDVVDASQISNNFRIIDKNLKENNNTPARNVSWNNLVDKPFFDEGIKTVGLDYSSLPEMNVNLGHTVVYKVTDDILTESILKGSTISATVTNSQGEIVSDTLTISQFSGISEQEFGTLFIDLICDSFMFYIAVATKVGQFEVEDTTITVPQTGTYLALFPINEGTPNSISLEYDYVKTLDIKFIPDALYTEIDQRIEESIGDIETLLGGI